MLQKPTLYLLALMLFLCGFTTEENSQNETEKVFERHSDGGRESSGCSSCSK